MQGLLNTTETIDIAVPASDTRFMVMAPGGENPRPNIEPASRKVEVRIQRQSAGMPAIQVLRQRLIEFETPLILGYRPKSTARSSAFGARSFQAHIGLIRAGSGIDRDLTLLGAHFRSKVGVIRFDKFLIETICLTSDGSSVVECPASVKHVSDA